MASGTNPPRRSHDRRPVLLAVLALLLSCSPAGREREVVVAVAANFAPTLEPIVQAFTARTGHAVRTVIGSTGELCAQVEHGARYHVLLAADDARPRRLEDAGHVVPASRFAYARGRLALIGSGVAAGTDGLEILRGAAFEHLALADPAVAPYGAAARAFLEDAGLWSALEPRIVYGRDVGQAVQFVAGGGAELGLVALAQARALQRGPYWEVPESRHPPIRQEAALLAAGRDVAGARQFLEFLRGAEARARIEEAGYAAGDG